MRTMNMRWFKTKDGTVYPEPQSAGTYTSSSTDCDTRHNAIDQEREALLYQARQTAHENRLKFQRLQTAVRSIVLRLRVLDIEQLAKDVGEDGTVPLRLATAKLRAQDKAYDVKEDMAELLKRAQEYPFVDQTTVASYTMPNYYTSSSTTAPYYSYGGKKP